MAGNDSHSTSFQKASNNIYPDLTRDKEGQWKGPFCFIQAADTQLGLIDSWNNVREDMQGWGKEIELSKKAIAAANRMSPKPRFFVVCGDMVNAFPWEKYNDPQVKDFKDVFKELDPTIPLVCVCGNHDIGDKPTEDSIKKYRNNFGDDFFTFWVGGVFFIVLNSQYFKDATQVAEHKQDQDKWLEQQLQFAKISNPQHVVVFQHIPWFFGSADEEDDYFNITMNTRKEMLEKLKAAGIKYVFAGHYHRNAGGFDGDLEVVVTSAIGLQIKNDKDSGMRIVTVQKNKISHEYYELDHVPTNMKFRL
ncbi:predicted protein [Nematostella vectensis]|uniref:Serine/threonine-protein phosphatase CPPED1 n=1 Tax=Nematostella vectensis TaxID=45351 RepID=A7S440_NEMVE|nr:predicted protein [Nematostella vectensis]|eukprot:XP_001633598.1 predicted protein [Nematostella vectensis]